MPPIILSIDGNIGSGKSTVVKNIKANFSNFCSENNHNFKICFLEEPVELWESIVDTESKENIIEKFYKDNEKYSFAFQMMAYISRLSLLKKAINENYDIIITERSIYTDRNVFAKMLFLEKKMSSIEWHIYNAWFDEFSSLCRNIKIIYIRTSPEICDSRIKNRARKGETIPFEYLQKCHYYHDSWLNNQEKINNKEVLIINGNEDTNKSLFIQNNFYNDIMKNLLQFINFNQ